MGQQFGIPVEMLVKGRALPVGTRRGKRVKVKAVRGAKDNWKTFKTEQEAIDEERRLATPRPKLTRKLTGAQQRRLGVSMRETPTSGARDDVRFAPRAPTVNLGFTVDERAAIDDRLDEGNEGVSAATGGHSFDRFPAEKLDDLIDEASNWVDLHWNNLESGGLSEDDEDYEKEQLRAWRGIRQKAEFYFETRQAADKLEEAIQARAKVRFNRTYNDVRTWSSEKIKEVAKLLTGTNFANKKQAFAALEALRDGEKGEETKTPTGFSGRVLALARTLKTPNYVGQVAISQVYDAYVREYGPTTLKEFKRELVRAAKRREILMAPAEIPEMMTSRARERSVTIWNRERVHLLSQNPRR